MPTPQSPSDELPSLTEEVLVEILRALRSVRHELAIVRTVLLLQAKAQNPVGLQEAMKETLAELRDEEQE